MIAQLETEHMSANLTLQKLWYFILPTMHTMQVLAAIVSNIGKVCIINNMSYARRAKANYFY